LAEKVTDVDMHPCKRKSACRDRVCFRGETVRLVDQRISSARAAIPIYSGVLAAAPQNQFISNLPHRNRTVSLVGTLRADDVAEHFAAGPPLSVDHRYEEGTPPIARKFVGGFGHAESKLGGFSVYKPPSALHYLFSVVWQTAALRPTQPLL
jgi:hypothetical protein